MTMTSSFCTTCGKVHDFPEPKFQRGQTVRIIRDNGYHHRDKVGYEVVILSAAEFLAMPCDEMEYRTSLGFGYIKESRLAAVSSE